MTLKTTDQLFPHDCTSADMRFSAFNPETVSYYCAECGGRLVVRVAHEEWSEFFEGDSLTLNEKVLSRIVEPSA